MGENPARDLSVFEQQMSVVRRGEGTLALSPPSVSDVTSGLRTGREEKPRALLLLFSLSPLPLPWARSASAAARIKEEEEEGERGDGGTTSRPPTSVIPLSPNVSSRGEAFKLWKMGLVRPLVVAIFGRGRPRRAAGGGRRRRHRLMTARKWRKSALPLFCQVLLLLLFRVRWENRGSGRAGNFFHESPFLGGG